MPGGGAILGIKLMDFGLGVFIQLDGRAVGQIIEQVPPSPLVYLRLLFVKPKEDGPKLVRRVVGQLITGVRRARLQPREGGLCARKHFGGELLRLRFSAGQFGKIYCGHKINRAWLRG